MDGSRSLSAMERPPAFLFFLSKVYAIAANTFVESIRQPVYAIIVGSAAALILVSPYITMFTLQQTPRMVTDMGLATVMLAGLLLAAFTASSVISEEIENKTALTVIAKPVGRAEFILGKFLGVVAGLVVATYLLSLVFVLSVSGGALEADIEQELSLAVVCALFGSMLIAVGYGVYCNYFQDRPFASRAIGAAIPLFTVSFLIFCFVNPREFKIGGFGTGINIQVIYAAIMLLWSILVFAGIAVAASTRLTVAVNVTICSGVFLLGLLSDYLFKIQAAELQSVFWRNVAGFAYYIVPNLQAFWVSDYVSLGVRVPGSLVVSAGVYAICLLGTLLFLAMLLFQRRQLA